MPKAKTTEEPAPDQTIPETPAEGASPNTPAVRASHMAPEPPDVYRQVADPESDYNRAMRGKK